MKLEFQTYRKTAETTTAKIKLIYSISDYVVQIQPVPRAAQGTVHAAHSEAVRMKMGGGAGR